VIIDPVLALMVTENGYDFSISRAPGKSDKHNIIIISQKKI
jgi:hypothetical protein